MAAERQRAFREREGKTMLRFAALILLLDGVASQVIDPRGARPVEPATKADTTQKEWPFCSDDDWGSKCPSGCRIQGLMDKNDHELLKKVEKIRSLLDQYRAKFQNTDLTSKQTYSYLKEKLTISSGSDNNYYDLAQNLRQRIQELKIKIDRQIRVLSALKDRVRDQVVEMEKLEVDIDIKLRSCKGSCAQSNNYEMDRDSYVTLDKQVTQLDSQTPQDIESVGKLYVMKSRPLKDAVVDNIYKSKNMAAQRKEDAFPEIKTVQLVLEEEGSKSSPATISKVPGTPPTSSKSITEPGTRGDADLFGGFKELDGIGVPGFHGSTKSISCGKNVKKTVVHTKDGPVEKMEEVISGGPECELLGGTKGSIGSLFPSLGSKTGFSGNTKGSLLEPISTGSLNPFEDDTGLDLGAFMTDNADDDLPDLQARSVKSTQVERQEEFVGKDCLEVFQKHLHGESNGLFTIRPGGSGQTLQVYCQQEALMSGWLLVQQRENGTVDFNRTWEEYRRGFGGVDAAGRGEVWLGNQNLHLLSNEGGVLLKVELEDWEGGVASAEYTARVGSEKEGYALHVSGYIGDAGDALGKWHSGRKFSTTDRDNDGWEGNCARAHGGGWWYDSCQGANLNGIYHKGASEKEGARNGVVWPGFKPPTYSLKTARMFIRPADL